MKLNKVAFLLHPLNVQEFRSQEYFYSPFEKPISFLLDHFSPSFIKNIYSRLPPHIFIKENIVSSREAKIEVFGVMCPMFPDEVFSNSERAFSKVVDATKHAINNGANIIVLTGFTSIINNQGEKLKELFENDNIVITTGNTLTAALCVKGLYEACNLLSTDLKKSTLAIIGATGDIGSACARMLGNEVKSVVLCARRIPQTFLENIPGSVGIEKDAKTAVKKANLVIFSTSSFMPLVSSQDINPFSIVCDVSLPYSLPDNFIEQRSDVFAFDAGKARITSLVKSLDRKWSQFSKNNRLLYGCIAEGLLLGLEGKFENFSLGRGNITLAKLAECKKMCETHNFDVAHFAFHEKFFTADELESYKKKFKENK